MQAANSDTPTATIPVRSRRKAMDWSLVLASQEIPTTITRSEEAGWVLLVEPDDYGRAVRALRQYHVENRHWGWKQPLPWSETTFHWGAVPACLLLVLVYQLSVEGPALRPAWVFDSVAVRGGHWWRLFTAVLLHADLGHLFANVTTGVLLFGLVMARFGTGLGLLAAYLAGAFGNLAGILLYARPYTGLGASGMVMGALGLLAFHSVALWRTNPHIARDLMRSGLAGVLLFLILGANPKSDVIAHLGGFVGGALMGVALSFIPVKALEDVRINFVSWMVLLSLLGLTGWFGLFHP